VDLTESSVYGKEDPADGDHAAEADIDRLASITGSADDPVILEGQLGEQFDALDASTDEEVDALEVNLFQEDDLASSRDGSGIIVDDLAEERIGKLTETGPFEGNQGAVSVSPGSEDTSSILRKHHPNTDAAHSDAILEGNVDDPQDESDDEIETA
jgi:hypothetical protein